MKKESVRRMGICILVSGVLYASSVPVSAEELFSDSETVQNALASETEDVFSDGSDSDVTRLCRRAKSV